MNPTDPEELRQGSESQGNTLPQTNMETHIAPFKGTLVFIGPFFGFPC